MTNEQDDLLRTISLSSHQLSNILNNMIDYARIEEKKINLEIGPVHLERFLDDLIDLFRTDLSRMHVDLIVEIASDMSEIVFADEVRLRQILTNLVGNSIKFSRSHSVIYINVRRETGGSRIEFSVEDEGIGISTAAARNLFKKFEQADTTIPKKYGGSGLGLAICKVDLIIDIY